MRFIQGIVPLLILLSTLTTVANFILNLSRSPQAIDPTNHPQSVSPSLNLNESAATFEKSNLLR